MMNQPKATVEELNAVLAAQFPTLSSVPRVTRIEPNLLHLRWPFEEHFLRPGGTISGPTLMTLVDVAAYMSILAMAGADAQAVTSNLTIHFLRRPPATDLEAVGRVRRGGRRQWTIAVEIFSAGSNEPVADAIVGYSLVSAGALAPKASTP